MNIRVIVNRGGGSAGEEAADRLRALFAAAYCVSRSVKTRRNSFSNAPKPSFSANLPMKCRGTMPKYTFTRVFSASSTSSVNTAHTVSAKPVL